MTDGIFRRSSEYSRDIPEGCVAVVEDVDCAELEAGDALPVAQVPAVPAQHLQKNSWGNYFQNFQNFLNFHQVRVTKNIFK